MIAVFSCGQELNGFTWNCYIVTAGCSRFLLKLTGSFRALVPVALAGASQERSEWELGAWWPMKTGSHRMVT